MAQVVSYQLFTTTAWVQSQASPCGICGRQRGTGTHFSLNTSVLPNSVIPLVFHAHCSTITDAT